MDAETDSRLERELEADSLLAGSEEDDADAEDPTLEQTKLISGSGAPVPCEFLTGIAGSGKTWELKRRIAEDKSYGLLCATTGIAAINLGTVTINSILKYFNTESLEDSFHNGWLGRILAEIAASGKKWLCVDEVSMMDGVQLDLIHYSTSLVNERREWHGKPPLGIVLTGDFCQLPPINAKWAFEADCWPAFEANTVRLTKCWRQSNAKFLEALNLIRSGKGVEGVELLKGMVEFVSSATSQFDGTTILPKNDAVNRFNWLAHSKVKGQLHTVTAHRWGKQRAEWNAPPQGQIPDSLQLKTNAYVMILSNDSEGMSMEGRMAYANGDCGHVKDFASGSFLVELVRNGEEVWVPMVCRLNTQRRAPEEITSKHPDSNEWELRKMYKSTGRGAGIHWDPKAHKWILGSITYSPLRLAYASTVHKSQGLSLDRVQLSCYDRFMAFPSMTYVGLSRVRTPEGLRVVGTPAMLASRVTTDPKVLRWL